MFTLLPRAGFALAFLPLSCTSHRVTVDPIEVKPIQVTVDVNVKVQRELEEFFQFEEEINEPESAAETDALSSGEEPNETRGTVHRATPARFTEAFHLTSLTRGVAHSVAQDSKTRDELQRSMKARYATLEKVRDAGKAGETYLGFVAAVKAEYEKEKADPADANSLTIGELIRAENADRRALYALLAKELKITADEVGKQNGIRNLKKADPDHWFQLKSGVWAQRKDIKEQKG